MEDGIEILDSNIYDLTELDTLLGTKEAFGWDLNAMMVTVPKGIVLIIYDTKFNPSKKYCPRHQPTTSRRPWKYLHSEVWT